ncbi:hypothetical protein ACQ4M4_21245 [Leptolyngbya sp. AN02str]|uniref:hypothetical protein n=1 Tax=Leptolyngbya sp. AN02str TaxID=3423363 RepID=UPI003D31ECE5
MVFKRAIAPIHVSLVLGTLLLTVGCNTTPPANGGSDNPEPVASATATPTEPSTESPSPVAEAPTPAPPQLSADGIGAAQLGMTLGELKQALPDAEFVVTSPFIVDFDAIAVRQNGEVQFHVLYLAGETFSDTDTIQGLFTDNSAYKTPEGIGVGSTLAEAEAAYGKATLSYSLANEAREYARFERQPSPGIAFATGNGSANPAGIYSGATEEYNETQQYRDDATIQSVLIVCLSDACTPES